MDFDAAWCPVCMHQIQPKRYHIPIDQPPAPAPAAPPSSPQPSPTAKVSSRKNKTLRTKSGLVQGTGRLRPNGTIKRTESPSNQLPPVQPPAPVRYRTIIDQGPTALYCSDDCRLADLGSQHNTRPLNPNRDDQPSEPTSPASEPDLARFPPSILKLAHYYNFPSLPPPISVFPDDSSSDSDTHTREYSSGIMMAAQRIRDFCPKPKKQTGFYPPPPEPKKHVPGWTDNTQGWRSSVYSMTAPETQRTITPATFRRQSSISTSTSSYSPTQASDEELLNKYSESFCRRPEARAVRSTKTSPARSTSSSRRERSLLPPGAEGKLIVPDVKLKVNSASSSSLSSAWSGPTSSSSKRSVRSPLSVSSNFSDDDDTDTQRCDSAASLPTQFKRPTVETRSWSYDNIKTYPLMPMKPKMIKRKEVKIVDGEEVTVEVEVEEPLKRLFLFPAPTRLS